MTRKQVWLEAYIGAPRDRLNSAYADICLQEFEERFPECKSEEKVLADIVYILRDHTIILTNIMALIDDLKQAVADNADATQAELDTVDSTLKTLEDKIANGVSPGDAASLISAIRQSTSNLRAGTVGLQNLAMNAPVATNAPQTGNDGGAPIQSDPSAPVAG